ncbi:MULTISPECIES: tol-pal system YbgF family protein [Fusobacterium]|uniref:tetratricopeptide repeat protein n=1 Tax=Fusobacterium TaxID=848 RepID=UPI00044BD228|nr:MULTISPECIES: tetratricopeptide repeat protein [Fusobacterium]EUB29723.1 tetratricopeptide repeat protein [Fusobacterium sp. OBRC1]WRL73163.1 tetratricopeptide repeat protein [Fusobacterium polymorphum]
MKKILFIIFIIAIFVTGGILGYKKIVADEREKKIIQMFNKDILDNFVENKKSVIERLKISTPEEANEIYNDYLKISQLIIENINTEHLDFLNNIYNKDSEYYFTEKDWETANKFLNNYDLEIFDLAETEVRIMEVPNYYYNIFKDYVTDDYREYLEITYKENEEPYFTDGSILVPYDKIADRLLTWENFLKKYPNSDLAEIANEKCNTYRRIYILGSDNAPTREGGWENNELFYIPENNLKEFNRFIEKYPDSPTVELIKFYLENYKNIDVDTMLNEKIDKEFYLGGIENREKGNLLSKESNDLLEEFKKNREEVISKLKNSNKEEANEIYEKYSVDNDKILEKINEIDVEMLDNAFYKDGNIEKDKLNKQNKFLDSYGLEVIQIEDGFMLIEKNKFYYNLFKNFVTDDYKEFLKLRSEDIDYLESSNSFDKYFEIIGDKIVAWEKFLEKYPDSKLKRKAQNMSYTYRAGYIFRLTSSETRESLMNGKANDAVKEFNRFIKKYPNSPTSDIIKYYLENYKEEDIDTLISKKLNKIMRENR